MNELPDPPRAPRGVTGRGLSRSSIVEAALGVLRKEGVDGVSMRRVATELSTGAASLYAHVAHKDELLELLFDEVAGEIPLPEPAAGSWREQFTQLWVDARAALLRYPDIARFSRRASGPHAARVVECTRTLLRLGGVPEEAVAWSVDVVALYVEASAVDVAGDPSRADEERFRFGLDLLVGGLAGLASGGPRPAGP